MQKSGNTKRGLDLKIMAKTSAEQSKQIKTFKIIKKTGQNQTPQCSVSTELIYSC